MIKRVVLTDGSGRWFDASRAEAWVEGQRHDGSNFVSLATGSEWAHEELYRTASGRWVLHSWRAEDGAPREYRAIEPIEAAIWLVRNETAIPPELADLVAGLEI